MDAPHRPPRIGLAVELRRTGPGLLKHSGSADHTINVLAGRPVRVACHGGTVKSVRARGEINVLPAGIVDDWFEDDPSDAVEVRLPHGLVRRAAEEMGLDADRATIEPQYHLRDAQIEHVAWALQAEALARFPNGLVYTESLGFALAVHLLSRYRAPSVPRAGLSEAQLRKVTEYIEHHLDVTISLFALARLCSVSTSHFRALFKRSVGVAVHEYVIQRRVERARSLLALGDLPASQVALAAGFSHQSHMARAVKRILGVTPAALRRAQ